MVAEQMGRVVELSRVVCCWAVAVEELVEEVVVEASAKKLTVPVAKGGVATESVTVAVQLVEAPAAKAGGLQLTVVTVGCLVTVTAAGGALGGLLDGERGVEGERVDFGGRRVIEKKKREGRSWAG